MCSIFIRKFALMMIDYLQLRKTQPKWRFVTSLWNVLDVAIVALFIYLIALLVAHVHLVNPQLDVLRHFDKRVYHETYWLAQWQRHEDFILGVIVLASWIKVLTRDIDVRFKLS